MFEMKNATYSYDGETTALSALNFTIVQGEAVAITGDNGCGKTTLLRALNGLMSPVVGEYYFDGALIDKRALADASFAKTFHRRIGFVFQNADAQLFCGSVEDEIAFGPRQLDISESDSRRRVDDCLALMRIENLRRRAPYALSGGEKRKVAFAAVLALNPEALVMDEPLENLDASGRELVLDLCRSLKSVGKTLIFATHNESLVSEIADRRMRLERGEIVNIEDVR